MNLSWLRRKGFAAVLVAVVVSPTAAFAATTITPTISGFSPVSGPASTVVLVSGSGYQNVSSASVGGVAAAVRVANSGRAYVTIPAAAITGPIRLSSGTAAATSSGSFTVTATAASYAQPVITSFSPTTVAPGGSVTVLGSGFTNATGVSIGDKVSSLKVTSDSRLSFQVPYDAVSGLVKVWNPQKSATSSASLTVAVPMKISSFTPASGSTGTSITVTGSGFTGTSAAQIGTSAMVPVTVASATSLSFAVPAGAASGAIRIVNGSQSALSSTAFTVSTPAPVATSYPVDDHITVDQFGYRPSATKTAVIRNPASGYDSNRPFAPGATYRLIDAASGSTVLQAAPTRWNSGSVSGDSGDFGWWFDFSSVTTTGQYYVLDVDRGVRSPMFRIDPLVYRTALKAAMRTYFYQRSGFAKQQPYAEACWTDAAAFVGPNQDGQARDVTDPNNNAKVRDLSGGWFDAGDSNKYVTFAATAVHQLLSAYEETPAPFTDDFNIPESGNGIPDVIDEVKWEIDWLKKMQNSDGSSLLKVGRTTYNETNPPSADTNPSYYVPSCTSATAAAAGMFAHAAYVYQKFPALQSDAADLKARAIKAYGNYLATPTKQTNCDDGTVRAGDADLQVADQENLLTVSAAYLYALTGDSQYQDRIKANYRSLRPYNDIGWTRYLPEQGVALLFYASLPNADATLKSTILNDKLNDARNGNQIYGVNPNDDLYRNFLHAPQYGWGSNQVRANYGNTNRDVASYHIAVTDTGPYQARAEDTLHYFHGVNPFGMVYLSNVNKLGPTRSVSTIFHRWFRDGDPTWDDVRTSSCGPAPGYVPGGPNASAAQNGVPTYLTPPTGQPAQKSYYEWNSGSEASYAITEPAIYYQSAYVKLVAGFAAP